MIKSEAVNEIIKALSEAQKKLKNAELNAVNPHFKSKYATLSEIINVIRPVFAENGLTVVQTFTNDFENLSKITVETTIFHLSGQFIQTSLTMQARDANPQSVSSAITYAKRISISAMAFLSAEDDDDANEAQETKRPDQKQQEQKQEIKQQAQQQEQKTNKKDEQEKTLKQNIYETLVILGVTDDRMKKEIQSIRDKCGIKKSMTELTIRDWQKIYDYCCDEVQKLEDKAAEDANDKSKEV